VVKNASKMCRFTSGGIPVPGVADAQLDVPSVLARPDLQAAAVGHRVDRVRHQIREQVSQPRPGSVR